jgi:hypothetical protein
MFVVVIPPRRRSTAAFITCALTALAIVSPAQAGDRTAVQTTQLVSVNGSGGVPNGPSGNAVISNDKRYARVIAFESEASDLVAGDTNGVRDIYAALRAQPFDNDGAPWVHGRTVLVSRTVSGAPANGPSFAPAVDGSFDDAEVVGPSCVAYLSDATNIVAGDTDGRRDAFLAPVESGAPKQISADVGADTTAVAVSGDCSYAAMITGGRLYLYDGKVTKLVATDGAASDPSFSVGRNQDLVFAGPKGAYLLREGETKPELVAPGGANPAYNDVKRQVVAYEKALGGHKQVAFKDLTGPESVASEHVGVFGNGDSRNPVLGNSGYSLTFETDASNLGVNVLKRQGDTNGKTDVYLFTDVRKITLVQSVQEKAVPLPGGGRNASMSFYNNYITFDSPAPLGAAEGPSQVYMRYLGGITADSGGDVEPLPTPEVGKTANADVVSGVVKIKLPRGAKYKDYGLSPAGANGFSTLKDARQIPMGSLLDTSRGHVRMETAVGTASPGQTQSGEFWSGQFQISQIGGRSRPITQLTMTGPLSCPKGSGRKQLTSAAKKRRSRGVWGNGKGRFRTRGRYASATVRGTNWYSKDTCTTTETRVRTGVVTVRDMVKKKNVTVRAGQKYVARKKKR